MTRPHITIFAGPSVSAEMRAQFAEFDWQPPIEAGDLVALPERVGIVSIIDGLFESCRSVWHKEILLAMSQGRRVVGASSMGALRAAELHDFGMSGAGIIYQAYRSGRIDGDDEVAVRHAPAALGWRPLTVPSVNVRATIAKAIAVGLLPAENRHVLLQSARAIFYGERTWPEILSAWVSDDLVKHQSLPHFNRWLKAGYVDLKRRDAEACLRRLQAVTLIKPAPSVAPPKTVFLERLLEEAHKSTHK